MKEDEVKQKELFDRIGDLYHLHYGDKYSLFYGDHFIHSYMFRGLTLTGMNVLDSACGGGESTRYLVSRGASVTGIDISENAILTFQKNFPQCKGIQGSVFDMPLPNGTFDCVAIFGGLHHMHPRIQDAVDEVFRVLRPGGYFCFFEPHAGSIPDLFRKIWYKADNKYFERNEGSVNVKELYQSNKDRFENRQTHYGGNVAFLLVYNSMIFRMPHFLKAVYSYPLMAVEWLTHPFENIYLSCFAACQWEKRM
jgi:SAM-dependent methyltransferase